MQTTQVLSTLKAASLSIGILVLLSACSITAGQSSNTPALSNLQSSMLGTWVSNCHAMGSVFIKETMLLASSTYKETVAVYEDNVCTQASSVVVSPSSGSFMLQGADENISQAWDVQMTYVDQNGLTQVGYTMILFQGQYMYMPSSIGTSSTTRPTTIDQTVPFAQASQ